MRIVSARAISDPLAPFHPAVREWFEASFDAPTRPNSSAGLPSPEENRR
jgi:hypothetical protein